MIIIDVLKMPTGVYERTNEHNQKNSEAKKGIVPWNKGKTINYGPWTGKNRSKETIDKISNTIKIQFSNGRKVPTSSLNRGRYKRWKINRSSGIKKKYYQFVYWFKLKFDLW